MTLPLPVVAALRVLAMNRFPEPSTANPSGKASPRWKAGLPRCCRKVTQNSVVAGIGNI